MSIKRQAVMRISVEALDGLRLQDANKQGHPTCGLEYYLAAPENMHRLLMLPRNYTVRDSSKHAYFAYAQIGVRLECPDFMEVQEGQMLPEVCAIYNQVEEGGKVRTLNFVCWSGAAVAKAPDTGYFGDILSSWKPTTFTIEKSVLEALTGKKSEPDCDTPTIIDNSKQ